METINARMVFEILGRPAEHIKETLNTLIVKFGSEKGIKVIDKQYHEPIKAEGSKDLFTAFAEVEAEFESMNAFFGSLFMYFPSNVEILSPRNIKIKNEDLNDLSNSLITRLHQYDAVSKRIINERTIMINKLKEAGVDLEKIFGQPAKDEDSPSTEKVKKSKSKKKN